MTAPAAPRVAAAPLDESVGTPGSPTGRTSVGPWLWVHLGSLVLAVPILAWINRDQWFAGDEWKIVTTNGLGSNPTRASVFAPHFEHWATLGILVYKALYGVFALRTYVPYLAVLFAVLLVIAHLTWRLLLRIGVVPSYATAVAALTIVLAVGWENRSTAWQMVVIAAGGVGVRRPARDARSRSAGPARRRRRRPAPRGAHVLGHRRHHDRGGRPRGAVATRLARRPRHHRGPGRGVRALVRARGFVGTTQRHRALHRAG